ncbi:MAG: hypothetical protein O2812_01215 [Chloroflexi bacterium]|nr:hypothetical protein [Chloroflexota bacterium]
MPAGRQYRFHQTGVRPAVLLRIGGTVAEGWEHYLDGDGSPLVVNYGKPPPVVAQGQFWTLEGVATE